MTEDRTMPNARRVMTPMCEYCNRGFDDGLTVIYAWHADDWCAECALEYAFLGGPNGKLTQQDLDDAPLGRPDNPTYEQPFVWDTADDRVVEGERR